MNDKTFLDLYREAWQKGDFDVDFHLLIHHDGVVENGRDIDAVGGFMVNETEDAVIIFVDTIHRKETDAQKEVISSLISKLSKKYEGVRVQKIVE